MEGYIVSNKILVPIIHGIGSQSPEFAEECIAELSSRIKKLGKNINDVMWLPIYWAQITEVAQLKYFRAANANADLDFKSLRKFVLTALGDASAYQKVNHGNNRVYDRIHAYIDEQISAVVQDTTNGITPQSPVIILAHSLGGYIMSNYIWDKQKDPDTDKSDLENMKTLSGIITFGCNIPLFTFAYSPITPIEFPPETLSDDLKAKAKWINYYDSDDILGYPLKCINEQYNDVVYEDVSINVGSILTSWNPSCHTDYWTDNDFTKPVAKYIANFI